MSDNICLIPIGKTITLTRRDGNRSEIPLSVAGGIFCRLDFDRTTTAMARSFDISKSSRVCSPFLFGPVERKIGVSRLVCLK